MNDLVIAKLKKDLKKVDKLGCQISASHKENTMESVKALWSIRKMARDHTDIDCSVIQSVTGFPDSSGRAIFFIELIRNNSCLIGKKYLELCLDHEKTFVCEDACYALTNYRETEVKKLLTEKFNTTGNGYLRDALAMVLSKFDDEEVPGYVLEYYQIPEKRALAIDALTNIYSTLANDMLLDAWIDNDKRVSFRAYQELQSDKRGTTHVARRLRDVIGSNKGSYQVDAIHLLGKHRDEDSIPLLKSVYFNVSQKARQQILLALGKIGTEEATDTLLYLMEKEEIPEIAAYGCMGLSTCEHSRAVDYLISIIREKPYGTGEIKPVGMGFGGDLYEIAAKAIKRNPVRESVPFMVELLSYEIPEVRIEMAKGLVTRKSVESLGALEIAINQETDDATKSMLEFSYKKLFKLKN
jgi:hypothetical protein